MGKCYYCKKSDETVQITPMFLFSMKYYDGKKPFLTEVVPVCAKCGNSAPKYRGRE